VWYVGATRAKENLYLLKPKKERYGYQLWQQKICLKKLFHKKSR
jgi:superfamily I DNA/RNA helicase